MSGHAPARYVKGLDGLESKLPSYHGHSTQMHSDALSTLTGKKYPQVLHQLHAWRMIHRIWVMVILDILGLWPGFCMLVAAMSFQEIYVIVNPQ